MHQEHNIPWNTLTSNFQYVHEDRRTTPPYSGFVLRNDRPSQEKELKYFRQRFISTIREFALTERKKYPPAQDIKPPLDGLLFSNELRDKYPEYLNERNQRLDIWIASAHEPLTNDGSSWYSTSHGGLADVVKILIHENEMEALLMLAHHPLVPLHDLRHLSWGHHFGFNRIVEAALQGYVFWNFISSSGHLASGAYVEMRQYKSLLHELTDTKDYEAQQIPHWEFYGGTYCDNDPQAIDVTRLHEYLKHLFRLCYRYDMLVMEYGGDPEWEKEILYAFNYITRPYSMKWD